MVIHRDLGVSDESATDEEQVDKVLYFYPELTPLAVRLKLINMLEGLIEFAERFSEKEDILDTVVMENRTWTYARWEPQVYCIVAVENHPQNNGDLGSSKSASSLSELPNTSDAINNGNNNPNMYQHQPYSSGLLDTMIRIHRMYCTFHLPINKHLYGDNNEGIVHIDEVKKFRKNIRKLSMKLQQAFLDLESLQNYELKETQRQLNQNN